MRKNSEAQGAQMEINLSEPPTPLQNGVNNNNADENT